MRMRMIRTGKFSVFEGPVCGKEKHDAPSISRYFITSEIVRVFFVVNVSRATEAALSLARANMALF